MEIKVKGIILKQFFCDENNKVFHVLTIDGEFLTLKAQGIRKAQARLKALLDYFTLIEITYLKTKKQNLLIHAILINDFHFLKQKLSHYQIAQIMQNLLLFTVFKENNNSLIASKLLLKNLNILNTEDANINLERLLLLFTLTLIAENGYFFSFDVCAQCHCLLTTSNIIGFSNTGLICFNCVVNVVSLITLQDYLVLKRLINEDFVVKKVTAQRLFAFLIKYLKFQTGLDFEIELDTLI